MSFDYINEAFKRLNVLDEEMFDSSNDGINKLSEFVKEDDAADDVITIIDPEAEDEDDLKDSYVGKVITNCNVCHSHIFNDKEDIEVDEDGTVNVDQACPYCGESEGFMIIGEIAPFGQNTDDSVEQSSEEDPALNEALGVGAGLALGGAALGAGHVISSLIDDVNVEESEEVLTEEEAIEDESVNEAVHLGPASAIGSAVADIGSKIADKVFGENIDEDESLETTDNLEEGLFDSKEKKEQTYEDAVQKILKKDSTKFALEVASKVNSSILSLADLDDGSTVSRANNKGVVAGYPLKAYNIVKELQQKYRNPKIAGTGNSVLLDTIYELRAFTSKSSDISSNINDLKELDKIVDSVSTIEKIGPKCEVYLKTKINKYVVDRLAQLESFLKKQYYIREEIEVSEENCSRAARKAMSEDFKEVAITTDDQHMEMTSDENGKVTVTTEPITSVNSDEEVIAPISDETTDDIMTNNDIETDAELEEPVEDVNTDFDEVDTDSMDELGESYLRNVYDNVRSFKTTSVMANDRKFIVEGIIRFNSGKQKKTGFIFESKDINTRGKVRFTGTNSQLTESKDAFYLVGKIDNKKLFVESLKYNYTVSNRPVRGIARRK